MDKQDKERLINLLTLNVGMLRNRAGVDLSAAQANDEIDFMHRCIEQLKALPDEPVQRTNLLDKQKMLKWLPGWWIGKESFFQLRQEAGIVDDEAYKQWHSGFEAAMRHLHSRIKQGDFDLPADRAAEN